MMTLPNTTSSEFTQTIFDVTYQPANIPQNINTILANNFTNLLPEPKPDCDFAKKAKIFKSSKPESTPQNLLTKLFLSYLYVSGQILAPWVQNKVSLQQPPESEHHDVCPLNSIDFPEPENNAGQGHNILDAPSKTPINFQNLFNFAALSAGTFLASNDPATSLAAGLMTLIPSTDAYKVNAETHKTDEIAKNNLAKRTVPISVVLPLPNLTATPGIPLSQSINLPSYFTVSNPNANIDLTIQQTNGTAAPSWLKMNMGPISLISLLPTIPTQTTTNAVNVGTNAYIATSNGLIVDDVGDPNNPTSLGSYFAQVVSRQLWGIFDNVISFGGNIAFLGPVGVNSTELHVLNVSNPANIGLAKNYTLNFPCSAIDGSNNYIYCAQYTYNIKYLFLGLPNNTNYISVLDVTNPVNPILKSTVSLGPSLYPPYSLNVYGNHAFVSVVPNGATVSSFYPGQTKIYDISNPTNPSLITTINSTYLSTATVQGNYLFLNTQQGTLQVYDITQINNPILKNNIYVQKYGSMIAEGKFLYLPGLNVVDIEDPSNPVLVTLSSDYASPGSMKGNKIFCAHLSDLSIYNAGQRVLSGTPASTDRGLVLLNVTASDGLGNSIVQPISIHVGTIGVNPIPNQQVYAGNTSLFTFNPQTFEFPHATFSYSANLVGGLPLPSFISFNSNTRTFIFAPHAGDQNSYRIQVTADDNWGGIASTTFNIVVPNRPLVIPQPLANQTAHSGEPFQYAFIPFSDPDQDIVSYSAQMQDGSELPSWLSFDGPSQTFSGTPFGTNAYPIVVIGVDGFGGSVSNSFAITIPPSAPIALNPPGAFTAYAGYPYSFTLNTNTFYDIDSTGLTYSAGALPSFLTFNNATRTFNCAPQSNDVGTYPITVQASSAGGTTSMTFYLNILTGTNQFPPQLENPIPNLIERAGVPFSYTFDQNTFADPKNGTLTYQAELPGGSPLPDGLYFDPLTRTLSGVVQEPQTINIVIRAVNPDGNFALDTFTLTSVESAPPIVLNPLTNVVASVNQDFKYHIPADTFATNLNDPLTFSVMQSNGKALPKWLKWDPKIQVISGKPGPGNAGTLSNKEIDVDVWASDGVGRVKSSFKIIVTGESFWDTFFKVGISLASIIGGSLGIWESRAFIWNHFNKKKYRQNEPVETSVGQPFEYNVPLKFTEVGSIKAYHNGKEQPTLPAGLDYIEDKIQGTPKVSQSEIYTINIYDKDGYCAVEFDLIIKN